MCQQLQVSRSGFYAWRGRSPSRHAVRDRELLGQIERVFEENEERYGSPRVFKQLQQEGVRTARKRVARLMRENGLKARTTFFYRRAPGLGRRLTTIPNRRLALARPTAPDQHWAGDVTYIRLGRQWRYLSVVLDLYSRRVIGWAMGKRRSADLTRAALAMALRRRNPAPNAIFHTDRGSEYRCETLHQLLTKRQMLPSVNRPMRCTDNAEVESFFRTIKGELIHGARFGSEELLYREVGSYIRDYYNRTRLHSSLGYRSPEHYESMAA